MVITIERQLPAAGQTVLALAQGGKQWHTRRAGQGCWLRGGIAASGGVAHGIVQHHLVCGGETTCRNNVQIAYHIAFLGAWLCSVPRLHSTSEHCAPCEVV